MRKTSEEKAITLIALIIIIVVLLILAVVAINSVTGDGIIQHAVNAKTEYEKAQDEEQDILSYYEDYLATEGKAGTWKQEGDNIINADGVKIPIGATVVYNPETGVTDLNKLKYTSYGTKTGIVENQVFKASNTLNVNGENKTIEWKVMGVENGKILLIASNGIASVDEDNNDMQLSGYTLSGAVGYNNAIEELNKICSIYGKGRGAESARSFSAKDVEKLTGITQTDKEDNSTYTYNDYGSKYSYVYEDGEIKLSENGGTKEALSITEVYFPDEIISSENPGPKEVAASFFNIDISNRIENEKIKNILLNSSNNDEMIWISEKAITIADTEISSSFKRGYMHFGIRVIDAASNSSTVNTYAAAPLYTYANKVYTQSYMIRPVVILEANTVLSESNRVYNIV